MIHKHSISALSGAAFLYLCNADSAKSAADRTLHCMHAAGEQLGPQTN